MKKTRVVLLLGLVLGAAQAHALNILLSNDDGFEGAKIRALYQDLKAAGHNVIISAPTQNNSGQGGAINFLVPLGNLSKNTRWGTVKAGAPGVGQDPGDSNVYYVDGTPVMATLYGLDVVAPAMWGKQPDLMISGPNDGNNLGFINDSSGTFNNALYGTLRGVPSIAVSDADTVAKPYTALTASSIEHEKAAIVVKLVAQLMQSPASGGRLLPPGVGLNVNLPAFGAGQGGSLPFAFTRLGTATNYQPVFYSKLSDSALAVGAGVNAPLPGVSLVTGPMQPPAGVTLPQDANPLAETNVIAAGGKVTVSVVEGVPQARRSNEDLVKIQLKPLFNLSH